MIIFTFNKQENKHQEASKKTNISGGGGWGGREVWHQMSPKLSGDLYGGNDSSFWVSVSSESVLLSCHLSPGSRHCSHCWPEIKNIFTCSGFSRGLVQVHIWDTKLDKHYGPETLMDQVHTNVDPVDNCAYFKDRLRFLYDSTVCNQNEIFFLNK